MKAVHFFSRGSVALTACAVVLAAGCAGSEVRTEDRTAGTDGINSGASVPRVTAGGNEIPNSNGIPGAVNGSITTGPGVPPFKGSADAPSNGPSATGSVPASLTLGPDDVQFVKAAAEGGLYEVAVGQLAAEKASRPEVRSFGSMLADHHSQANDKLKQLMSARGMTVSTSIPAEKQAKIDQVSQLSGAAFDRQFIETVGVEDHRKDIAAFEKASRGAGADDIRAFASETLPTLKSHLAAAQRLHSSIDKSGGTS